MFFRFVGVFGWAGVLLVLAFFGLFVFVLFSLLVCFGFVSFGVLFCFGSRVVAGLVVFVIYDGMT